jgi:hypothetical protein
LPQAEEAKNGKKNHHLSPIGSPVDLSLNTKKSFFIEEKTGTC